MDEYEPLKLKNQLCFPLYAASKAVVRLYQPFLSPLELTYTQYIVLLSLYERDGVTVKELGNCVCLDSGTLSPLLLKLIKRKLVSKKATGTDRREKRIFLTQNGLELREQLKTIPSKVANCVNLSLEEAPLLKTLCEKVIGDQCSNGN